MGAMKKKRIFWITFVVLALNAQELSVWSIELYQQYLSPHKGWKCAYALAHPFEVSCSEFGKNAIANLGTIAGLEQLQNRFKACEMAYFVLGTQKQSEVSGCCGGTPTVHPKLIDVSKSEGTLTFAYEYPVRWTNTVQLDWTEARKEAMERCQSWGFAKAHFFERGLKNCMERDVLGECTVFQVLHKCECKN
jgi:putative component of membrane protein insertase Oxa1/YidC/SpoIIIJ protein YidD